MEFSVPLGFTKSKDTNPKRQRGKPAARLACASGWCGSYQSRRVEGGEVEIIPRRAGGSPVRSSRWTIGKRAFQRMGVHNSLEYMDLHGHGLSGGPLERV